MNDLDFNLKNLMPKFNYDLMEGIPPRRYNLGDAFAGVVVRPYQFLVIGSPPGVGKTSLIMGGTFDFLYNQPDLRALVLNVEMPPDDLLCREVARQSGIGLTDIDNRLFRNVAEYRADVEEALAKIGSINDRLAFCSFPFTLEHVAKVILDHKSDLIVLDYVQRITASSKPVKDQRQGATDVMNGIRKIANWGKAVIVVSSVARDKGSKGRAYENLSLGSFKESGEIEFGADNCYLLSMDGETGKLHHVKARHSKKADVYLTFDCDCHRWNVSGGEV